MSPKFDSIVDTNICSFSAVNVAVCFRATKLEMKQEIMLWQSTPLILDFLIICMLSLVKFEFTNE